MLESHYRHTELSEIRFLSQMGLPVHVEPVVSSSFS